MLTFQTHTNFLPSDAFKDIKSAILGGEFPWRRRDTMANDKDDQIYFSYGFYNEMSSLSELYDIFIIPVLKKLNAVAPIQVRANMFISKLFDKSSWHIDYPFKCKTAILYLNDCDGGTELQINNKVTFIKAEANKMLIFDTAILHRAITSKKQPIRYIINFNYFTEGDQDK